MKDFVYLGMSLAFMFSSFSASKAMREIAVNGGPWRMAWIIAGPAVALSLILGVLLVMDLFC